MEIGVDCPICHKEFDPSHFFIHIKRCLHENFPTPPAKPFKSKKKMSKKREFFPFTFRKVIWERADCVYEGISKFGPDGEGICCAYRFIAGLDDYDGPLTHEQKASEALAQEFIGDEREWERFIAATESYRLDQDEDGPKPE